MITHYLKTAFRNILKNRIFSAINAFGLAISIACTVLVMLHIKEELSFDKGFSRSERIFRITQEGIGKEDSRHWAATAPPLAPSLKEAFPEVEQSVRLYRPSPYQVLSYTSVQGNIKRFEEKGGFFADPQITNVFDMQFIRGDRNTPMTEKNTMVISEAMAIKYFGNEEPVGKILLDDNANLPYKITGVFRSYAFPTHLQFDYLLSMPSVESYVDKQTMQRKTWSGFYSYVLLGKAENKKTVEDRMGAFMLKFYASTGESKEEILSKRALHLQPVRDIHLHSKLEKEMYPNSDITYVYIFSIAAIFIIFLAAVNFINMSTANAFNRVKEIGVRKVAGATKKQLVFQFLGESFLMTLLATLLAIALLRVAINFYNGITSGTFRFTEIWDVTNVVLLLGLVFLIGLLAGLYPAWFISNVNSAGSLKAKPSAAGSGVNRVRKGLIVFQFAISVFMIFSTLVVYRQLQYFHKKDIGFDREQLVAVKIYGDMRNNLTALLNDLSKNSAIKQFSSVSVLPGQRIGTQPFRQVSDQPENESNSARMMWTDEKFLPTLNIPLKEGRNFFRQFPDIRANEFLLNESAVKLLGLKDPVGKQFVADGMDTGTVVGIVRDFNFASLHSGIDPLVIQYQPYRTDYVVIKVAAGQIPQTLEFLKLRIKTIAPSAVFSYSFMDEQIDRLYESENRLSRIFKAFAGFAILISCLGLFGLSAYSARIRTKEVGIRKVLGASVTRVAWLLSTDFVNLVLIAIIIAWPIAWWVMNKWLEGFAYRIEISYVIFLLSGSFAIIVAIFTVGIQAVKAALANPVRSLATD